MKKIFEKINFRQPKYMLPAILYIPLLGASYFIFDLFHTETADIPDKTLQTTEFLNPELPEAQIKDDGIGSKYENMEKSWGKIQDYSAVGNIERDEPDENKEEYESQYTQDDIALLDEQQQEKAAAAEIARPPKIGVCEAERRSSAECRWDPGPLPAGSCTLER